MDPVTGCLLVILCSLALYLYYEMVKSFRFWKEKGVAHPKPKPCVGNWLDVQLLKLSEGEYYSEIYKAFPDEKYVGLYRYTRPVLLVRDPEIADRIFTTDFSNFVDRGLDVSTKECPMDDGIIVRNGNRWRGMRSKLTPAFTTGKIKGMMDQILSCGQSLVNTVEKGDGRDFELKDLMSVYTCNVIASCGFGLNLESQLTPESEFVKKAKNVFYMSPIRMMRFLISSSFSCLSGLLNVSMTDPETAQYFGELLKEVINERINSRRTRNDFVQLLLQLKEKGSIKLQSKDPEDSYLLSDSPETAQEEEFTYETLIAQAYTFLSAGFDTTSTVLQYLFFELSLNQIAQDKAREEIRRVLGEENGQVTYQSLHKMTYLDCCIYETLRKYPTLQMIRRVCTKEYMLDGQVKIYPGMAVIVPVSGFHYDEKYFDNPNEFIPERMENIQKGTFIPFGSGPRMCIGMRFAMVNLKVGLVSILMHYKAELSSKTKLPLRIDPQSLTSAPMDSLWCRFTKV